MTASDLTTFDDFGWTARTADLEADHINAELAAAVLGLVTMEDVVEELVGDIHDEYDRLPTHVHPIGDGWIVGGGVALGDLAKTIGADVFPNVDAKWTLADWVDRVRIESARSDDTIRAGGVDVLVRKVRRNRVAARSWR